jgi:signal transduction histidine kinase
LHSSKLDCLGLATAAKSFCRELSEKTKVEIVFGHAGIPRTLSKEVSLCLFRVLQEGLQDAVKHSGVRSFTVDLQGTEQSIELTVADTGNGFEEHEACARHGLGLISMRERLHLVHGELSVKSQPGTGTTIRARVPLKPTNIVQWLDEAFCELSLPLRDDLNCGMQDDSGYNRKLEVQSRVDV